jgi:hypothetical protein
MIDKEIKTAKNEFENWHVLFIPSPVTVAERSKKCTVFACSEAGNVGSNPTQDMDV